MRRYWIAVLGLTLAAACESDVDKYLRLQGELSSAEASSAYANYHHDSLRAVRDSAPPGARRHTLDSLVTNAFGDAMDASRKYERIAAELHLMGK